MPYTPALNPNSPLTVEFWAKMNFYGVYVPVCSMNQPARDGGYEFYVDGNSAGYEWHSAGGGGYNMLASDFAAPTVRTLRVEGMPVMRRGFDLPYPPWYSDLRKNRNATT